MVDELPTEKDGLSKDDVILIMKSGYLVLRERLEPQLDTFAHPRYGRTEQNTLIIADYNTTAGQQVWKVRDVVASLYQNQEVAKSDKFKLYIDQAAAISDDTHKNEILPGTSNTGWAIDAYKFLPGWKLAIETFPHAKWFVGIDDDTFLLWNNLYEFLRLLDHTEPQYLGTAAIMLANNQKFIHGGSIIIASHAAMYERFISHAADLPALNAAANELCCGDGVLGMAFERAGIKADDSFRDFFNGDNPRDLRLSRLNFCLPVLGLHHVEPLQMRHLESLVSKETTVITWARMFELLDTHQEVGWDYTTDQRYEHALPSSNHQTALYCSSACSEDSECLGWSFATVTKECYFSKVIVPGKEAKDTVSGVNRQLMDRYTRGCHVAEENGRGWKDKVRTIKL